MAFGAWRPRLLLKAAVWRRSSYADAPSNGIPTASNRYGYDLRLMSARSYLAEHMSPRTYSVARLPLRVLPSRRQHYARQARIENALGFKQDRIVRRGPFAGMHYTDDSFGSSLAPKLLGSYELELHEAIEQMIACQDIKTVVNVGSAEGYYAVGFALRCPEASVYAYDSSPFARRLCRRMAVLNGVADRVLVSGRAGPETLRRVVGAGSLVLSDCEGCEKALIDPSTVPELLEANMIIELHDFVDPMISSSIQRRFEGSHNVELVDSRLRDPAIFRDPLERLAPADRAHALEEGRPGPMQWAVITL